MWKIVTAKKMILRQSHLVVVALISGPDLLLLVAASVNHLMVAPIRGKGRLVRERRKRPITSHHLLIVLMTSLTIMPTSPS